MSYETKSRTSSLATAGFMGGSLLFAVLAGLLVSRLVGRSHGEEALQPIVVATRSLTAGQPMRPDQLRLARWPESSIPHGSFRSVEAVMSHGKVPLIALGANEPVLGRHLASPRSGFGVAAKLEPGQRAMALHLESTLQLAQLVYPGAHVDVLSTQRRPAGRGRSDVKTKVLLQDVAVLAVDTNIDPLSAARHAVPSKKRGGLARSRASREKTHRVVTLALTAPQAERLALAVRRGEIDLVLRSPRDRSLVQTEGATPARILDEPEPPRVEPTPAKTVSVASTHRRARVRRPRPRPRKPSPPPAPQVTLAPGVEISHGIKIHRGGSS